MKRREFLRMSALGSAALWAGGPGCRRRRPDFRPNIVLIVADDLGCGDLSRLGQKHFRTPNLDRMAAEGEIFTNFYAGSTVCAPSRSCLMTGLHTGHTPIRGNREVRPEGQHPLPGDTVTVAKLLREAGYATGAFGKWGLGPPGSEGDPGRQGFDEFFGYNCQRYAHNYYPQHLWRNRERVEIAENAGAARGVYAPRLIHGRALEFIEANRDRPFFLFVPTVIPHAELFAPEEYIKMYRGKYPPEKSYRGVDEGKNFKQGAYGSQPEAHAAFVAMIHILDEQVGEIVGRIEDLGLGERTVFLFSSDNGPHKEGGADPDFFDSNGPFRGYKRDLYEGGIRVPLLARWRGRIQPGRSTAHAAAFWDFLPTFCELAGIEPPEGIDGISFLPELLDRTGQQKRHAHLYWEFHEQGGKQAVRSGDWKAVRLNVRADPEGPVELYDLTRDPGETRNVAGEYPGIVAKMAALMKESRTESEVFRLIEERRSRVPG